MKPAQSQYHDIKIGAIYEFKRTITHADVCAFADLTGDHNPLHVDQKFGAQSQFGKNVVHGMLAGSLFSTLVGMYCPGTSALYVSQTLQFKKPVFYGDTITVCGTVIDKYDSIKMVVLKTEVLRDGEVMVSGEARAKVLE
ncbi:MAG: MaoC family dehydratase [bacterium]|nr:MaoC family dehydratase [bacterium]